MNELGRITTVIHSGAQASNPARYRIAGSTKATPMKIADNDAAAVSIQGAYRREADVHHNISSSESSVIWPQTMAEFVKAIREKMAKFLELLEQIAAGRFLRGNLAENSAETNANLESEIFPPAQADQKTLKILPFGDIEPEQVLFLLRSD